MKSKLQPKDIARYLPYGAKFISELDVPYEEMETNPIHTCNGIVELFGDYCLNSKERKDAYPVHMCKLVLNSPNLTTPITIKGKTITPLLELAKIAFPDRKFELKTFHALKMTLAKSGDIHFDFQFGGFSAVENDDETYEAMKVPNQSELFDWLDEHFIDYRGLIERGLAIDVTTLKENPYK